MSEDPYAQVARQAADIAVAAADKVTEAACRSSSVNTARLDKAAHAAHNEAVNAERYAGWAEEETASAPQGVRANYAAMAVDAAVRAQLAAGVETTATGLRSRLNRPLTPEERAERESAARRDEAREEEEARAATGMDSHNRALVESNRWWAESLVSDLAWTAGHLRVLEAAESDRLYWRNRQAWKAKRPGVPEGGSKISREKTAALYKARFLVAARRADGTRVITLSPMGKVSLELVRLYPQGLYDNDRAAYEARFARSRSWLTREERKTAARRLTQLDRHVFRRYRRPVTLVEQEVRAQEEAAGRWEDDGGYCPGVEPQSPAADATATPAADPVPSPATAPKSRLLLRRLFGPRTAPPAAHDIRNVIRRPQRTLTPDELKVVHSTALLNLQGALIMGIVDPVPNPSPMPETDGAWVREHVWPDHLTRTEARYPWGFLRWSTCELGTCWNCLAKRCDLCAHRQQGGPYVDKNSTWIYGHRGQVVATQILRPGGEPCVWWCRCPCAKDGARPPTAKRRGAKSRAEATVQPPDSEPSSDHPPAPPRPGPAPSADPVQAALF
ncbi:hypothetical protein GTY62_00070 [Streptomyces sp. SID724]|uniref:DUF6248 family natural product biosynthesis protein n=1 Tax=Streptomyces sp. SID724 TaxID=2690324 RepID=UPI001361D1A3|nr:hypothetical protein [Streptomyces sp. SID724]